MELGELEHVDEPADPRGQEGQPVWVKHAPEIAFLKKKKDRHSER